jgi:hypothetical protein
MCLSDEAFLSRSRRASLLLSSQRLLAPSEEVLTGTEEARVDYLLSCRKSGKVGQTYVDSNVSDRSGFLWCEAKIALNGQPPSAGSVLLDCGVQHLSFDGAVLVEPQPTQTGNQDF